MMWCGGDRMGRCGVVWCDAGVGGCRVMVVVMCGAVVVWCGDVVVV